MLGAAEWGCWLTWFPTRTPQASAEGVPFLCVPPLVGTATPVWVPGDGVHRRIHSLSGGRDFGRDASPHLGPIHAECYPECCSLPPGAGSSLPLQQLISALTVGES